MTDDDGTTGEGWTLLPPERLANGPVAFGRLLLDSGLTGMQVAVYLAVLDYPPDRTFSASGISSRISCSKNTAEKHLNTLITLGWIGREMVKGQREHGEMWTEARYQAYGEPRQPG